MNNRKNILTSKLLAGAFAAMLASGAACADNLDNAPSPQRGQAPALPDFDDSFDEMQRMMDYMRRERASMMRDMQRMQAEMDRGASPSMRMEQRLSPPSVQLDENEKNYLVTVNMPHADKKSIKVKLQGNVLTISASQKMQQRKKNAHVFMQQSMMSQVTRSFTLPGPVQQQGMKTRYRDGKLQIKIPKDLKRGT